MFFDFLSLIFGKIFLFTGLVQGKGSFPKPLSAEEEKKYLEAARAGDNEAKNILIKHNMRLVAHIAKKYSGGLKSFIMGHFVLSFLLLFIVLGMLAELVLAIVNYMFSNGGGYSSYIIPIVIMPAVAACVAGIIMYITYRNVQTGNKLAEGFDKVSHGEFGYQLEVPRRGNMKQVFIDFNKMSTELKSIQTLKDEFIHDFSHEFKTPIASINGFANLLLEGGLTPEEEKQYLRIISDESARLSALAENTLMLNRLENQQFVGEVHPYRLDLQ